MQDPRTVAKMEALSDEASWGGVVMGIGGWGGIGVYGYGSGCWIPCT